MGVENPVPVAAENIDYTKCHICGKPLEKGFCFGKNCDFAEECFWLGMDNRDYRKVSRKRSTHELLAFVPEDDSGSKDAIVIIKVLHEYFENNTYLRGKVQGLFPEDDNFICSSDCGPESEIDEEIATYLEFKPFYRVDHGYCVVYKAL